MPLSHEQLQELSLLQDKYNNGNITKKQYEILKKEVLSEGEDIIRNPSGNIILAILILLGNLVRWIWRKSVLVAKYIHKIFGKWSSRKNIPLWKVYTVLMSIVFIFMIGNVLYMNHIESIKKAEVQAIQDKKNAEEKVLEDKKMADIKTEQERIEKEKANTPKPIIEIQSTQGSQGKKTTYLLKFTASGADTITVNGESLTLNGSGIYEKEIPLESIETAISLTAKNKYYSTESAFLITRDKNTNDVAKEEKAKKDAEEKKQVEEKARTQALNDTFKKNCIDPTGTSWELDYYLRKVVLKDPDSYERINTYFKDEGDMFNVFIKYRAKNSYGGYVIELAGAKVGQDCKLIDYLGSVNPDTLDL